ncbi:S41 family peptidase [Patescibacteria group bacterium]|nr:S41 family peptidase [Patescibacteria group bacterium]
MLENSYQSPQPETSLNQQFAPSKPKSRRVALGIIAAIVLIIVFCGGVVIGLNHQLSSLSQDPSYADVGQVLNTDTLPDYLAKDVNFKLFWKVWDIIRERYINRDKITDAQLFYGALAGSVASLNDPYSVFLPPDESEKFSEELAGKFEGIGAEIGIKNDRITIISPLPDSPAEKAGLRALDKVIAIDGLDTVGISLDTAVNLIRGEKGTPVILTVIREGEDGFLDITITRDEIHIQSVKLEIKDDNIAYLEISNFNSDTQDVFKQKVNELLAASPRGIILDLRNNPGGYLDTAIKIAGYWVENGQVVVKEEFSIPELNQEHFSSGQSQLRDYPTVVLINQASASASEIVAGALQDYDLAQLVGMQTFGKGSVQELEQLSDGSSIKLTVAKWLTPYGRSIDENGISPDIEIDLTNEDYENNEDPQLAKALELLNQ